MIVQRTQNKKIIPEYLKRAENLERELKERGYGVSRTWRYNPKHFAINATFALTTDDKLRQLKPGDPVLVENILKGHTHPLQKQLYLGTFRSLDRGTINEDVWGRLDYAHANMEDVKRISMDFLEDYGFLLMDTTERVTELFSNLRRNYTIDYSLPFLEKKVDDLGTFGAAIRGKWSTVFVEPEIRTRLMRSSKELLEHYDKLLAK